MADAACSFCGKPQKYLFVIYTSKEGEGPVQKEGCFGCIQKLGEEWAQEERKKHELVVDEGPR